MTSLRSLYDVIAALAIIIATLFQLALFSYFQNHRAFHQGMDH